MKRGLLYTSLIAMIGVINFANAAGTYQQQHSQYGWQQQQTYPQQQQLQSYVPQQQPQYGWQQQQTYPQQQQLQQKLRIDQLEAELERIKRQVFDSTWRAGNFERQANDFKRQADESSQQCEAARKELNEIKAKLLEAQGKIEQQNKDLKDKCEEIKKQKKEYLTITQKCDEIEKQREVTAAKVKEVEERLEAATLELKKAADEKKRRTDQAKAKGLLETDPIYGGGERIFNYEECTSEGKMERSACLIATLKKDLSDLRTNDYLFHDISRIADKYCEFNNLRVQNYMDRVLIPAIAPSVLETAAAAPSEHYMQDYAAAASSAPETVEAECCLSERCMQGYAAAAPSEYSSSSSSAPSAPETVEAEYCLPEHYMQDYAAAASSVPEVNRSEPSSNRSTVRLEWFPGLKITNSHGNTIQSDHVDVRALCDMLNTTSSAELRFQLKGEQVSGLNVRMLTLNMLCKGLYFIEHDMVDKFGGDFVSNDPLYTEPEEDYQMDCVNFAFTDELTKGGCGYLIANGFSLNTSDELVRSTSNSQARILGIHLFEFYRSEVINAIINLMNFSVME